MSLDQAKLLFALLALFANAITLWIAFVWLGGAISDRIAALRDATTATLGPAAVRLAFLIAGVATFGSLYLSEVADLVPCRLCWFQRIAMYPLFVIFGVGWLRRDRSAWAHAVPLAAIGAVLAAWHLLVQRFPSLEGSACELGVPCSASYFEVFGFMTIPYMALSGFVAILALGAVARSAGASVTGSDQE